MEDMGSGVGVCSVPGRARRVQLSYHGMLKKTLISNKAHFLWQNYSTDFMPMKLQRAPPPRGSWLGKMVKA